MSRLKECDINRDNILALIWKIDLIAFLCVRVVDEQPFDKIRHQLECIRSVIMNKVHTTKHLRTQDK